MTARYAKRHCTATHGNPSAASTDTAAIGDRPTRLWLWLWLSWPNASDQRLATAGLATPLDSIASPLHRLVRAACVAKPFLRLAV